MSIDNLPMWFLSKRLTNPQVSEYAVGEKEIESETDKAVLIRVRGDFGTFTFWCPKSIADEQSDMTNSFTHIEINGELYVKEILMNRPKTLKKLGLTKEQVASMRGN